MLAFSTDLGGLTYEQYRFSNITLFEGFFANPYVDSKGIPTIGYGFNLQVKAIFDAVVKTLIPTITSVQAKDLFDNVMNKPYDPDPTKTHTGDSTVTLQANIANKLSSFGISSADFILSTSQSDSIFAAQAVSYEDSVKSWLGIPTNSEITPSPERAALVSLAYNGIFGASLKTDIIAGNRAAAWYEIRYRSNGTVGVDLSGRRYAEAKMFGLYADHSTQIATSIESHQLATVYAAHRALILSYEKSHNPSTSTYANEFGIVDIYAEMQPAIAELKIEYKIPTNFAIEEVQQASAALANLNGDGTTFDNLNNDQDLLIGSAVANTLNGGQGNDVLIGLGGDDILIGGVGNDIISGGAGFDTLQYQASVVLLNVDIRERTALAVPAPLPNESDVIIGVERIIATNQKDTITLSLQPTTAVKEIILGDGDDNLNLFAISTTGAETFVTTGLTINMGKGNDIVRTYSGDDTYLFTQGDGVDVIEDRHGLNDILILTGSALTSTNAIFTVDSLQTSTVLTFTGDTTDKIASNENCIEKLNIRVKVA